jgi:hypothetical protein
MDGDTLPVQNPINFLQDHLLPQLRPQTVDSQYLDRYSSEQLRDHTYRTEVRTDNVGDGNCLVPQAIGGFDDARFSNPPAHIATVLVREDSLGGTVSIQFEGFVGTHLTCEYANSLYGVIDEPFLSVEIEGSDYELYQDESPYNTTTPPWGFQLTEEDINLSLSTDYNNRVRIPEDRTHAVTHNPESGRTNRRPLNADGSPVISLDEIEEETIDIYHVRPEIELEFQVTVTENIPSEIADDLDDDFVQVTFMVRNDTDVVEDYERTWHERRVFYPSLKFEFDDTLVGFPPQQHDVQLEQALRASTDEENDSPFEGTYRQQDCILTQVVEDFDDRWETRDVVSSDPQFRTTSFGVYDYIEQEPYDAEYRIDELIRKSDSELADALDQLEDRTEEIENEPQLLHNLRGVLLTLRHYLEEDLPKLGTDSYDPNDPGGQEPTLRKFQWDALQERIELLLDNEYDPLVVQAPTSAGKTLVYYGSSMLSVFTRETRAAFPFPTRMLTEDKLEEVIDLAYAYNEYVRTTEYPHLDPIPDEEFTVGVALGGQESTYDDSDYLHTADLVDYIDTCHACGGDLRTRCVDCNRPGRSCLDNDADHRHNVICDSCQFEYSFVFDTERTPQYLPSFTVGTPEKFFTMPTIETQTHHSTRSSLPFYGAPYRECENCGRALTDMNIYRVANDRGGLTCIICYQNNEVSPTPFNDVDWKVSDPELGSANYDPIGHIVLDETHMYTGQFGITISVIIRFFEVLASRLQTGESRARGNWNISADSGTATISNKIEHISKLLSANREDIRAVPGRGEHDEYFEPNRDRIRYRILASTPVAVSNRESFRHTVVRSYDDFHNPSSGTEFRDDFEQEIQTSRANCTDSDYELILGYVYRILDGEALQDTIGDLAEEISDGRLNDIPFLSGESSKRAMRESFGMGSSVAESVVLANLVVSLGIDIPELNNLILFGAPRSMSEQMQTVGRTGRQEAAGHANIHLYPGKPRDMQLQRNFHGILSEIDDYYDRATIQPTNPHIADLLFDYVLSPFLTLEFAIREEWVDSDDLHIIQDLHEMFDQGGPTHQNQHVWALYEDLQAIFCPSELGLDSSLSEMMENQLVDRLFEYVGENGTPSIWRSEALDNQANNTTRNINRWFYEHAGSLELRGQSGTSLELKTEWVTPSEVEP